MNDRLILRGADGYDEARFARVFNARRPERDPAAVLLAESEDDIVEGVRLARDRGWKVAIRAGGHSFPAWSVRDGVLLIDLGAFKETAFDESTGIVSVTPAVTCGELNAYLSGYSHSVQHVSGMTNEGKPFDETFRITDVYRKSHGKWVIVQEHISEPPHAARW